MYGIQRCRRKQWKDEFPEHPHTPTHIRTRFMFFSSQQLQVTEADNNVYVALGHCQLLTELSTFDPDEWLVNTPPSSCQIVVRPDRARPYNVTRPYTIIRHRTSTVQPKRYSWMAQLKPRDYVYAYTKTSVSMLPMPHHASRRRRWDWNEVDVRALRNASNTVPLRSTRLSEFCPLSKVHVP